MNIRKATTEDVPQIVELLKKSLGESKIQKSERLWDWKHNKNVFGKSEVILAFEGNELIGVRPFMKWNWYNGSIVVKSLRAVDTAIHPNYQGKGIFKKLTSQLVEETRSDFQFIFNTPNKKSRPGYLKLGWKSKGRMSVYASIRIQSKFKTRSGKTGMLFDNFEVGEVLGKVKNDLFNNASSGIGIHPLRSTEFLKWRYVDCPVHKHYGIYYSNEFKFLLLIFRPVYRHGFVELRILEIFTHPQLEDETLAQKFDTILNAFKPNMITFPYIPALFGRKGFLKYLGFLVRVRIGPVITINYLDLSPQEVIPGKTWFPNFGDLELF